MKKILFINMGAHGHVNPTLGLTAEMVRRGYDVSYAVPETFRAAVEATGARFLPYESQFGGDLPRGVRIQDMLPYFPLRIVREAAFALPQLMRIVEAEKPDVIAYDKMCLAGYLVTHANNIPALSFLPTYAANEHFSLMKAFPQFAFDPAVLAEFHDVAATITKEFGVAVPEIKELFAAREDLNVVFLPRSFQPQGETFDDRYVFVGPGLSPRTHQGEFTWRLGPSKRRLLISLGTVFNDRPEFFRACFEAFGSLSDWEVAMATGHRIDRDNLGRVPDNMTLAAHLPQLEILPDVDVFLTHGGMGSTMESLFHAKPMVVIPQMPEQAMTARQVATLGLGRAIDPESFSATLLREAVLAVADDASVHERVREMSEAVRAAGGAPRAADAIARFVGPPSGTRRSVKPVSERTPELG